VKDQRARLPFTFFFHYIGIMNEKDLVGSLKRNDPSAMQTIFAAFHSPLCHLVYTIAKDTDQTKDIVQDVFIKLWQNRQQLEITGSLQAYLRRAAVNTALNYLERSNKWKKLDLGKADLTTFASNPTTQAISYQELSERADQAIHQLPIRTRAVFTLIRQEEMSYKEVAETLGISPKAVEKEMMRALKLLREALKDFLNPSVVILLMQAL
jgi:RNA polymerase sigma-70 factor, ECF subfamily